MMIPAFTQGLYGRLREQAGGEWQRYVSHPFLQQLAAGSLSALSDPGLSFLNPFRPQLCPAGQQTSHVAGDARRRRLDECHPC